MTLAVGANSQLRGSNWEFAHQFFTRYPVATLFDFWRFFKLREGQCLRAVKKFVNLAHEALLKQGMNTVICHCCLYHLNITGFHVGKKPRSLQAVVNRFLSLDGFEVRQLSP